MQNFHVSLLSFSALAAYLLQFQTGEPGHCHISSVQLGLPEFQVPGIPNEIPLCYHLCQDELATLAV